MEFFRGPLLTVLFIVPAAAMTLIEEGQPRARVVLAEQAGEATAAAADELVAYLAKMSGAELPLVRAAPADGDVLLGTVAGWPEEAAAVAVRGLGPEGYLLRTEGQQLLLLAHDDLAVRHVVVAFLEHLGCRWFYPGEAWEEVPKQPTVRVTDLNVTGRPTMGYRNIWYGWGKATPQIRADYEAWFRHNKQGGHITGGVGHAYASVIHPREFEVHPEWFALVDGRRIPNGQLCTSHPEVIEKARVYARRAFRQDPAKAKKMVSLSPNDGGGYCECPKCQAEGSISDRTLRFCNRVAEGIEAEFPDKWVAMYAYYANAPPPTLAGHPQVIIYIATSFIVGGFSVDELIEGWSNRVHQIGIRDYYCVDLWTRDQPRWQIDRLRERIPYYHRHKVVGINAESSCNWAAEGLNYYVGARLQWNAYADVDAILADYYETCWGPAAPALRRYHARWKDAPGVNSRLLALSNQDLAQALDAAQGHERVLVRVRQMLKYQHWLRLYRQHAQAPPEAAKGRGLELARWTFGLLDSGLVHSYAMYRDPRIFGDPWLGKNKPEWQHLWGQVEAITDEEGEAAFRVDLAELPPPAEIPTVATAGSLQPLSMAPAPDTRPANPIYRGGGRFFVQGQEPGPAVIRVSAGHIRPASTTLTYGLAGSLSNRAAPFEPQAPAQTFEPGEHTVELPLRGGEIYVLDFASKGGSGVQIDFGGRPHAWVLGHHGHIISGTRGDLAFYVPADTAAFVVGLVTSDGWGRITIKDPTGAIILQQAGNYATSEEFGIEVPPEHAGQIWRVAIDQCEDADKFYVVGIPSLAAHDPRWLLGLADE